VLNLLEDAGCTNDELRLVRLLLANTKVQIRVNATLSDEFEIFVGAFQGDALSGSLFTLSLAGALYHLRAVVAVLGRPNPPISIDGMPAESEYADDVDFMDENLTNLTNMFTICKDTLAEWNLNVNDDKTEFVHVYVANKMDKDSKGQPLTKNEEWRISKLLGSLLCSTKDILNRIQLGNVAFANFKKVWLERDNISLDRKLLIYEAQVTSVIMYNSCSWAAPKHIMEKLDTCQRRHLRYILNYRWPNIISNKNLYKRCNDCKPLTVRVEEARWRMLGHILRSPENTPAQTAFSYAVEGALIHKSRRGRHQINLYNILKGDLDKRGLKLNDINDLFDLRMLAKTRSLWKEYFDKT
jgi:hypothetical protein